jgi:hypothetical protein
LGHNNATEFTDLGTIGKMQVSNLTNGWMTAAVFEQLALAFTAWLDAYRARFPLPHRGGTAVLLLEGDLISWKV